MKNLKTLLLILPFLFISNVKAAAIGPSQFVGQNLDDEWFISANSSITGDISFYNSVENVSTSTGNFVYADVCTTGIEPTLWVTSNSLGQLTPSTKWYKVNTPCSVSGYSGSVYRQIIFIKCDVYF